MGKKQQRQQVFKYEATGVIILAMAALALGKLGIVGRSLDVACIYLAGSWSFLVPIFVGYAAVVIMVTRSAFAWSGRHMGLLILLVSWLTLMEVYFYNDVSSYNKALYPATWHALRALAAATMHPSTSVGGPVIEAGGGLLGYAVFSICHRLFALPGTFLALTVLAIIGIALVTQQSLVNVIKGGTGWTEKRLSGVWKGLRQYVDLLFGTERKDSSEQRAETAADDEQPAPRRTRGRRKPELVVEGDWRDKTQAAEAADGPVIHDFAQHVAARNANLQMELASEPTPAPDVQTAQVVPTERGLAARFPDAANPLKPVPERKQAELTGTDEGQAGFYPVGAMVHDDNYQLPPVSLFALPKGPRTGFNQRDAQENAMKLQSTLESFGVQAKVVEISRGPTVTRYELQPAVGVKVSRIVNLTDDIALALAARDLRVEAPVPGKSVIGIEVPNSEIAVVTFREVLESDAFQTETSKLAMALGRDITGRSIVGNLQKMPHLLVAGATGSGKSVCINGMIASILLKAKPHEVKFLMIDPKMVELSVYNGIPHLLAPVVTDPRKAAFALKKVVAEMESRYQAFADRGARDIERYNQMLAADGEEALPYIVVIVDELADLMMVAPGEVEDAICRIAQMARAAGIHLIVATQRPSVDVITGVIKANIPSRIAFAVSSMADSRTILDGGGAEKLLGRGDMLYVPVGASKPTRVQGVYISEDEIENLVEYVKGQQDAVYTVDLNTGEPTGETQQSADLDALFTDAVDLVVDSGQASVSMIQRRFRVGYSRAARIIDQMELQGIVGPFEGSKPREVLIRREDWESMRSSYQ